MVVFAVFEICWPTLSLPTFKGGGGVNLLLYSGLGGGGGGGGGLICYCTQGLVGWQVRPYALYSCILHTQGVYQVIKVMRVHNYW